MTDCRRGKKALLCCGILQTAEVCLADCEWLQISAEIWDFINMRLFCLLLCTPYNTLCREGAKPLLRLLSIHLFVVCHNFFHPTEVSLHALSQLSINSTSSVWQQKGHEVWNSAPAQRRLQSQPRTKILHGFIHSFAAFYFRTSAPLTHGYTQTCGSQCSQDHFTRPWMW